MEREFQPVQLPYESRVEESQEGSKKGKKGKRNKKVFLPPLSFLPFLLPSQFQSHKS
jgi:hypothetical protein